MLLTEMGKYLVRGGITLRIYPVVFIAFPRMVKSTVEIMGHQFDAGTMLTPCICLVHHREDLSPEPKQFRP